MLGGCSQLGWQVWGGLGDCQTGWFGIINHPGSSQCKYSFLFAPNPACTSAGSSPRGPGDGGLLGVVPSRPHCVIPVNPCHQALTAVPRAWQSPLSLVTREHGTDPLRDPQHCPKASPGSSCPAGCPIPSPGLDFCPAQSPALHRHQGCHRGQHQASRSPGGMGPVWEFHAVNSPSSTRAPQGAGVMWGSFPSSPWPRCCSGLVSLCKGSSPLENSSTGFSRPGWEGKVWLWLEETEIPISGRSSTEPSDDVH